jgi:hypothetical protein
MRFAGGVFNPSQTEGVASAPGFDTSKLSQTYGNTADAASLALRALSRSKVFGSKLVDNLPGLGQLFSGGNPLSGAGSDPVNQLAGTAIEAGGRFLPYVGLGTLILNAGKTSPQDTLTDNPYYQQYQRTK